MPASTRTPYENPLLLRITLDGDQVWTFSLNGLVDQMKAPPAIQTKVDITGAPVKIGGPHGRAADGVLR
jgi:hypothetical protein